MRNVFALAGLAVMAAAVVLGDGGHPYQYETSAGWGDHHHNALVSSRQSPNPLRSRQALAALLTPGVVTAIVSVSTRVGSRKVKLIVATCTLRHMRVMVIKCLWITFWPDPP